MAGSSNGNDGESQRRAYTATAARIAAAMTRGGHVRREVLRLAAFPELVLTRTANCGGGDIADVGFRRR